MTLAASLLQETVLDDERAFKVKTLEEKLLSLGLISPDQQKIAFKERLASNKTFEQIYVDLGFISAKALAAVVADQYEVQEFNLKKTIINSSLLSRFPRPLAERYKVLPLDFQENVLHVAMVNIFDIKAVDQLQSCFENVHRTIPYVATEADLWAAIDLYYGYSLSMDNLLKVIEDKDDSYDTSEEKSPVVQFINMLLIDAVKQKASDIHFEPEGLFVRVRYRLDGLLKQVCTFHYQFWPSICVRLKIISGMNIAESRLPQNGRLSYCIAGREVDFRFSSHPTVHGENIVVRILDKLHCLKTLDSLGFDLETEEFIKHLISYPEGMIAITGPTGSGKTTTLYSMLSYLNSRNLNIMTLEEPVEYELPFIRQTQINEMINLGFAEGVRSILRQDPDILFIGEVRDEATAQMALRASMTGHLVFTTLHTNSALGALNRFVDLGISSRMFEDNIIGIISQRLLRKLCPCCRQKKEDLSPEERQLLGLKDENTPTIFVAAGCKDCHFTGYKDRTAIAEILAFQKSFEEQGQQEKASGMWEQKRTPFLFSTLKDAGIKKVLEGETSLDELKRVVNLY
jgi:type II secretory ATPase GspE/PulE/Tfp pilus assembly ATPase PilB-like protein